jgi:hypothetical protein
LIGNGRLGPGKGGFVRKIGLCAGCRDDVLRKVSPLHIQSVLNQNGSVKKKIHAWFCTKCLKKIEEIERAG